LLPVLHTPCSLLANSLNFWEPHLSVGLYSNR